MKPIGAWALVALILTASTVAILGPWQTVAVLLGASILIIRRGRGGFITLACTTMAIYALLLALVSNEPPHVPALGRSWSLAGAWEGVEAAARMVTVLGVNLAVLSIVPAPVIVDGLRLPRSSTVVVAAVLLAANDLAEDHARLREAVAMEGAPAKRRRDRWRAGAAILPALFVAAERRSAARRDALSLGGVGMSSGFVPILAVAALAAAGRMLLLPLPNVKLTYAVVFLGGVVYGWRVSFSGGALGMLITDLMISGLSPFSFVNVPAMGALAFLGAALRRVDFSGTSRADRVAGRVFAFAAGVLATFAFSILADVFTWAIFLHARPEALVPLLLAGVAFNIIPAVGNGVIFSLSVGPVQRAFRALAARPNAETARPLP